MVSAAIFDLDGTLVTFAFDIREWRKALLELMDVRGFSTQGLDVTTPTQQILDNAKEQAGAKPERYEELHQEAFSVLDTLELKGVASAKLIPGVVDVLRTLRSKGVKLCVVTNSGRKAAVDTLTKWGLTGFFEFVLTRNETETMKPRPEGLLMALRTLGLGPHEAYYIGDSRFDIMAAKQAGMKVVSVTTGNYNAELLRQEGADIVTDSLDVLPSLFGV